MNIDEAIIHCHEVADRCAVTDGDRKCEKEHRQIAAWLTAYKAIRESGSCHDCSHLHNSCQYAPEWGDLVRFNCPFYSRKENR